MKFVAVKFCMHCSHQFHIMINQHTYNLATRHIQICQKLHMSERPTLMLLKESTKLLQTHRVSTICPTSFLRDFSRNMPTFCLHSLYIWYRLSRTVSVRRTLCETSTFNNTDSSYCKMDVLKPDHTSNLKYMHSTISLRYLQKKYFWACTYNSFNKDVHCYSRL